MVEPPTPPKNQIVRSYHLLVRMNLVYAPTELLDINNVQFLFQFAVQILLNSIMATLEFPSIIAVEKMSCFLSASQF